MYEVMKEIFKYYGCTYEASMNRDRAPYRYVIVKKNRANVVMGRRYTGDSWLIDDCNCYDGCCGYKLRKQQDARKAIAKKFMRNQ